MTKIGVSTGVDADYAGQRSGWRYAPLILAAGVYIGAILTLGYAAILYLLTFPASLLLLWRLAPPRGLAYWLGLTINGVLFLAVVWFLINLALGSSAGDTRQPGSD